jgi:hypothetical protein
MQGRKVTIANLNNYRVFKEAKLNTGTGQTDVGMPVRCAYKDCSCSPDCAACENTGSNPHFECNRDGFVIGYPVD